uniref:FAR1 domain-containing protein n=1 Tax=Lactuca sativa TaxID=4236 RepID=A0A9R1WQ47_LACSA|nr:hypothetical protein LSAT_V11C100048760 [Lactuca sativa]
MSVNIGDLTSAYVHEDCICRIYDSCSLNTEDDILKLTEHTHAELQYDIVSDEIIPKIGSTFNSLDETVTMYRNYATKLGFSIKYGSTTFYDDEIKSLKKKTYSLQQIWRANK